MGSASCYLDQGNTNNWGGTYADRTYTLTIEEQSYDHSTNQSEVKWTLSVSGGGTWYNYYLYATVNGTVVCNQSGGWGDGWSKGFPVRAGTSASGTLTIDHGSDGKKSISGYMEGYADILSAYGTSTSLALTDLDRAYPSIYITASAGAYNSISYSGSSGSSVSGWQYSLDGGGWTSCNSSGSITVSEGSHSLALRATKTLNGLTGTSSTVSVDTSRPSVSFNTGTIETNAIPISASSNIACSNWQYSINGGSTWTEFYSGSTTSASTKITGLAVNTSYSIAVRAKKTSNGVWGASSAQPVKTLSGSVINSVGTFYPDTSASDSIYVNYTVYVSDYSHKFVLKNGSTTLYTWNNASGNYLSVNSTLRNQLLNLIPSDSTYKDLTLLLYTYDGSTQIGNESTRQITISTSPDNSGPTISSTSLIDSNSASVAITGSQYILVSGISTAAITVNATARNGASIASYKINGASKSTSYIGSTYYIPLNTSSSFTIVITDSRGYSVTKTLVPTQFIKYQNITLAQTATRTIPVSSNAVSLDIGGVMYVGYFNASVPSSANTITITYRYKESGTNVWSNPPIAIPAEYISIDPTTGSYTVSGFTTTAVFDYTKNYDIQITVTDKVMSASSISTIQKGRPVFDWGDADFRFNVDTKFEGDALIGSLGSIKDYMLTGAEYTELTTW